MPIKLIVILFFSCSFILGQEKVDANIIVVEDFSKSLFDEEVSANSLVELYIDFEGEEVEKSKIFTERFI